MMSAKEAKNLSDTNSKKQQEQVDALLKAIEIKVKEASTTGETNISLTFPLSQISPETLKLCEKKLKDLGYNSSKSENYAYKTVTLGVAWG